MQHQVHHTGHPVYVPDVQDVASACGIRAMPTFQAYFGGQKVAELSGADPRALEDMIKRCDPSNSLMKHETLEQMAIDTGSVGLGQGSRAINQRRGLTQECLNLQQCCHCRDAPEWFAWPPKCIAPMS